MVTESELKTTYTRKLNCSFRVWGFFPQYSQEITIVKLRCNTVQIVQQEYQIQ